MWPLSALQLSPVARPCYRRSCPNGPRFDQREITRMMSLLANSVISLPAKFGRYWGNSGQSEPPKNKSRSALINLADDRALPVHGSDFRT
jgi:hypothetical protein